MIQETPKRANVSVPLCGKGLIVQAADPPKFEEEMGKGEAMPFSP